MAKELTRRDFAKMASLTFGFGAAEAAGADRFWPMQDNWLKTASDTPASEAHNAGLLRGVGARLAANLSCNNAPSTDDYIQDGLVGMWDGINHGTGDAPINLKTGAYDLIKYGGASLDGGMMMFDGTGCFYGDSIAGGISVEVCIDTCSSSNGFFVTNADYLIRIGKYGNKILTSGTGVGWNSFKSKKTYSVLNRSICYLNGVETQDNTRDYWGGSFNKLTIGARYKDGSFGMFMIGGIFCVRIYSKVLSPDEVWRNYEIDAARFGIS